MYPITFTSSQKQKRAMILSRTPAAMPSVLMIGVGDKKKKYQKWLEEQFSNNTHVIKFLTHLNFAGKEENGLLLFAGDKMSKIEAEVVKEFLENTQEALAKTESLFGFVAKDRLDEMSGMSEKFIAEMKRQQELIASMTGESMPAITEMEVTEVTAVPEVSEEPVIQKPAHEPLPDIVGRPALIAR